MRYLPNNFFENVFTNGRYGDFSEGLFHGTIILRVVDDDYISGEDVDGGWYHWRTRIEIMHFLIKGPARMKIWT